MNTLDTRLVEVVEHAYEHAPAFRQIMDAASLTPGEIRSLADWPRIPVTSKDALIQLQQ